MPVWTIVKTIAPRCCGRPDTLLPEAEPRGAIVSNYWQTETALRQQARIEKIQTPVERDSLVQWTKNIFIEHKILHYLCISCLGKLT